MSKMITILGPTASGKTVMAVELAKKFNGEIVCADSRTIYKNMNIGTAKPTKVEQQNVPHHLLDIVLPGEVFSVLEFQKLARSCIADIQKRGKLPFLVGGSGLYIDSVLFNYSFQRSSVGRVVTKNLSLQQLQSRVKAEFPEIELNNSDIHNQRRLEQILSRGMVKSDDRKKQKIDSLVLGLDIKIPVLKKNIAQRTESMLNKGFIQEVENIISTFGEDCPQLHTTGYKEVLDFIHSGTTKNQLELQINSATYQLAKKQITWFKRNPDIIWVNTFAEAERNVSDYLKL